MANKLLIVIPDVIPTIEIIMRTLKVLSSHYKFKIVLSSQVKMRDLLSGQYKILFIRCLDPSLLHILKLMVQQKIPYLYYIDDNFWELGKGEGFLAECYSEPSVVKTLNYIVKHAYQVIAGSETLKNYIKPFNSNVISMKAAFDFKLIQGLKREPTHDFIKIIYSGSLHREQDFKAVVPALKKILIEYSGKVILYFKGYMPQELKKFSNVEYDEKFYSYNDFIKAQYQFAYDIGVAPIHDSPTSRAKSNLKYREYGACGIAGIYSNIPPYLDCVVHGENGYLVEHNEESWYQALKALIENKALREKIIKNASEDLFLNYTHDSIVVSWEETFKNLSLSSTNLTMVDCFFIKIRSKLGSVLHKKKRAIAFFKRHGLIKTSRKIFETLWGRVWFRKKSLKKHLTIESF